MLTNKLLYHLGLTMGSVTEALESAIKSDRLKSVLTDLNMYFYNRKHEGQIRDALLVEISKNSLYVGLSEYPKSGAGAVDLTLFHKNERLDTAAVIEFKHHYPKDMNYKGCLDAIVSDTLRTVERHTTHFVLIMQVRNQSGSLPFGSVKFMERNDSDVHKYIKKLEDYSEFPPWLEKRKTVISVIGDIHSEYWFFIYKIRN